MSKSEAQVILFQVLGVYLLLNGLMELLVLLPVMDSGSAKFIAGMLVGRALHIGIGILLLCRPEFFARCCALFWKNDPPSATQP